MTKRRKQTPHMPMAFYNRLPLATQVIFFKIRDLADKYAFVHTKTCEIRFHERSNPTKARVIDRAEARRIFYELYPTPLARIEVAKFAGE